MKHPKYNALDQILHSKYDSEEKRLDHLFQVSRRRIGDTTRKIDEMVQRLFTTGEVFLVRPETGTEEVRDTWSRLLRRVDIEHGGLSSFVVDHRRMVIQWPGFEAEQEMKSRIEYEILELSKKLVSCQKPTT